MKYRRLGQTDLVVSTVGFGVWSVSTGWWGRIDEPDAVRLLQQAFDKGVTLFDTADTYGLGAGEEVVAKALGPHRHDIVVGTKFGYDWYTHRERTGHKERPQKWEPDFIRYACEQSLRRLQTDHIDLYQLHNPRLETIQRDDVFATLEQLVQEGKIRYYGVAIGPDIGWQEEGEASMRQRKAPAMQIIYNILEQQPAHSFFPIAQEEGTGLLSRVPHASDVLTDQFVQSPPTFDSSDHRAHRKQEWLDQAMEKRRQVAFLAEGTGRTLAQAAIQFCLAQGTIASVLPNITTPQQLSEYIAAPEAPELSAEELQRLLQLYASNFGLHQATPQKGAPVP